MVSRSKNGTFMFKRAFMEYHSHRFEDASLMFMEGSEVLAVLPANKAGDRLGSHDGLTYGGLLFDEKMSTPKMMEVVAALKSWASDQGFKRLTYKASPSFYHRLPASEDLYALTTSGARLYRRDVTTILRPADHPRFAPDRRWSVNKAKKNGVEVRESDRFDLFWPIVDDVLMSRHGARPTHTLEEIELLRSRFPSNIRLFGAFLDGEMVSGGVVFETEEVCHTQYLSTGEAGRKARGLDLLVAVLIEDVYATKDWFSFGISTEDGGKVLNEGLIRYKESYGGRAALHDFYELDL